MILADKIMENRKKNGWSQEELADKLGVSRQSVSKWEGAQAIPDMKKILQMADLFGVSTDYLLRDEIEETEIEAVPASRHEAEEEKVRRVSLEEANAFLDNNERTAHLVSTGVALCILSPVCLLTMVALSHSRKLPLNDDQAVMIGLIALLFMVGGAVALFVGTAMKGKLYEYLERQCIDTEYGVSGMVKEKKTAYRDRHSRLLVGGIVLCVTSAIPFFAALIAENAGRGSNGAWPLLGVSLLLILVALGVKMIVLTAVRQGGFDKLLEEGDYTRDNKKLSRRLDPFDGIYWGLALAIYLGWSFLSGKWDITWVVWPIAGVVYAVYREVVKLLVRRRM